MSPLAGFFCIFLQETQHFVREDWITHKSFAYFTVISEFVFNNQNFVKKCLENLEKTLEMIKKVKKFDPDKICN